MLKKFFAMIFCMAVFVNIADAADSEKPRVVVMDLGARQSSDIDTKNIGSSASDLLLQALFDTGKFKIYDWEDAEDAINAANLPTSGIIPRSAAQKIAELLNADYLIYGNINSLNSKDLIFEIAGNGGNFRSVKATMIIRVMDVKTGEILIVARGEGVSKRSEIRGGKKGIAYVRLGDKEIPFICFNNAVLKATRGVADKIVADFFNEPPAKK